MYSSRHNQRFKSKKVQPNVSVNVLLLCSVVDTKTRWACESNKITYYYIKFKANCLYFITSRETERTTTKLNYFFLGTAFITFFDNETNGHTESSITKSSSRLVQAQPVTSERETEASKDQVDITFTKAD